MKKFQVLVTLFATTLCMLVSAEPQEVFSRTFMLTRPASYNLAMDQQLWHNFVYSKNGPIYGAFQAIGYYQKSRPNEKNALYFLIDRKSSLLVAGDAVTDLITTRDIRAEWVNLPNDFQGRLSLCPQQTQIGFTLMYNQDLKKFLDVEFLKNWSVGIEMPVIFVENNINLSQYDMQSSGSQPDTQPDIKHAFNQVDWCFSKIPSCKQKLTNVANLKLTIGRAMMNQDFFQLQAYSALEIPIATHHSPEYLFSPQVGYDRHVGIGGGALIQLLLNYHPEKFALTFFSNLEGIFYIRNKQHRTFDLKGKPWSRYMQYVRRNDPPGKTVPGVNVMTFPTLVRTYGTANYSFGWRINVAPFEFEIGYDLWGHGGERVELRNGPPESPFNRCGGGLNDFGIAGSGTILFQDQPVVATSSASTIAQQFEDDLAFVPITYNDIDLCSAQAASALNHTIHASVGLQNLKGNPNFFGGWGFFFEFAQKNSPLNNFGVWFKIGSSF